MKINVLTPDIYNKIAAGEVVERPYSVVKELVENALDAGASEITVETEGGGKILVRVSDNGGGIERDDLPRAFLPHATSKLSSAEELMAIHTLGFRGEAIASIAAVSRMKIISKTRGGAAYSLRCDGGVLGQVIEDGGADGTVVTVEELFYNVPARRKFLKGDSQEDGDIAAMMARFILLAPEVAFTYVQNGKVKYRSLGDGLKAALVSVYGSAILEHVIEIDAEKHGIRLKGFLGNQFYSKPNRSYANLFLNGRYVVNQTVATAAQNAYGQYLMKRQFPFYALSFTVPPEIVDVNVTPDKSDVRFADNRMIYGIVYSVLSAVLDGSAKALEYTVSEGEAGTDEQPLGQAPAREFAPADASAPVRGFSAEMKPASAPDRKSEPPVPPTPKEPRMSYEEAKKELQFDISPVKGGTKYIPRGESLGGFGAFSVHSPSAERSEGAATREKKPEQDEGGDWFEENKRYLESLEAGRERIKVEELVFRGELFQTYLIYERGDTAYFIDQHAAHERLIYDRLREKMKRRAVLSQPMLLPYVLNVNPQEYAFLLTHLKTLFELGFEIEEFGGDSFKISAVPSDLKDMRLNEFFGEVLSSMESLRAVKLEEILKDKLASAACKAAVKGGELLTQEEAKSLMQKMDGDVGLKCPHGRPVCVKMTKKDFEKLFKRIV